MLRSRRPFLLLAGAAAALLLAVPGTAPAAPITVELRVEGATATLYEGPVSTEGESIETPSSGGAHPCNYAENGNFEGFTNGGTPGATPTTALHDAAVGAGLAFDAQWSTSLGDFFVTRVGADQNQEEPPFASWGYAVNGTTAPVGGCQIALAPGSEVLWAYNYFNLEHHLALTGPGSVEAGAPFTVHVSDARTGAPLAGAAIGELDAGVTAPLPGAPTTDAAGDATVSLAAAGAVVLKATRSESVRSNGLAVCVHRGADGTCGTSVPAPVGPPSVVTAPGLAVATAGGVHNGGVYRRGHAPRVLSGTITVPAGGTLRDVRILLERRHGRRCLAFSGSRAAFVHARCGTARFFSVGDSQSFSYLLPAPLPAGRYVYDVEAIDASGRTTHLVPSVSHVVFRVL
jgi:hypothetical protein